MLVKPTTTDITEEGFEAPDCIADFTDLIEDSINAYTHLPFSQKERTNWKRKLNELIDDYNDRRGVKIYAHIR